jgi:hypothetical protein
LLIELTCTLSRFYAALHHAGSAAAVRATAKIARPFDFDYRTRAAAVVRARHVTRTREARRGLWHRLTPALAPLTRALAPAVKEN